MKGLGLLLVVMGIALMFVAKNQRAEYDTAVGNVKTAVSQSERERAKFWDGARVGGIAIAVFGALMYLRGTRPS